MIKLSQTEWYRETQRMSGFTPRAFAFNTWLSLAMLAGLAAFAIGVNL